MKEIKKDCFTYITFVIVGFLRTVSVMAHLFALIK